MLKEDRPTVSRVVRWLTGHAFLRMQNWRAEMAPSATCRGCQEKPERADHILLHCGAYLQRRADCFRTYCPALPTPQWKMDRMIRFLQGLAALEEEESEDSEDDSQA